MKVNQKIFLVGCPRSGTTLLQQMLDTHSQVAITPETHFMRLFWEKSSYYGDLAEDDNYHKLISDLVAFPEFTEMELHPDNFRQLAFQTDRNYGSLFNLLLEQFAELKKAEVVGEKTPHHLKYIEPISKFFPSALFIHIIRDPRAVVNSWRKVSWSTGNIIGDARIWHRDMSIINSLPNQIQPSLLNVYYEKLVLEPEKTLTKICNFIGIEFETEMLNFHGRNTLSVNVEREPWKANAKRPLNPELISNWQSKLSVSMVLDIEAIVWTNMIPLGYQLKSPLLKLLFRSSKLYLSQKRSQIKQQIKTLINQ
ncbi:MAG: sulfotransferase [Microcoleaceae cyanobacterium MO_207.B10]|nr:sulfotransferase [Microcoleaceae cyanobacterium MO_207.B10]